MWWTIGKRAGQAYLLLLMVAVGGLVMANLAGLLAMIFIAPENKSVYVQPWVHTGWMIGAGLALFGALTGKLRMISGSTSERLPREAFPAVESREVETEGNADTAKPSSFPSAVLGIGFFGGLFGSIFGASLLLLWFSLNYSPFALPDWSGSIRVGFETIVPGRMRSPSIISNHPIAVLLVAAPTIAGSFIGAVVGGIGAALGKVHDG